MQVSEIFRMMPERYKPGVLSAPRSFYFSIGDHKFTVLADPERVTVTPGKGDAPADVVLKATEAVFLRMVVDGKLPGPMDIAMGRIKTNDPKGLAQLREIFDFSGA